MKTSGNLFFFWCVLVTPSQPKILCSDCMAFYLPETVIIFDVQFFLSKEGHPLCFHQFVPKAPQAAGAREFAPNLPESIMTLYHRGCRI